MRLDPNDGARADLRAARIACMLAHKRVAEWEFFPDTLDRPAERRMSQEELRTNLEMLMIAWGGQVR